MNCRKLNSTTRRVLFYLASSVDHVSPVTGATATVEVAPDGGVFQAAAGAVTEVGSGWYALGAAAADRATLGECAIRASATGADTWPGKLIIVPWDPFDPNLALPALPAAAAGATGGLPTVDAANGVKLSVGVGVGQLSVSAGQVAIAQSFPANFASLAIATTGLVSTGATSLSLAGGAAVSGGTALSFSAAGPNLVAPAGGYNTMSLIFQGGANVGERRQIALHAVTAGVHTFTLTAPFASAPGAGDPFLLG